MLRAPGPRSWPRKLHVNPKKKKTKNKDTIRARAGQLRASRNPALADIIYLASACTRARTTLNYYGKVHVVELAPVVAARVRLVGDDNGA